MKKPSFTFKGGATKLRPFPNTEDSHANTADSKKALQSVKALLFAGLVAEQMLTTDRPEAEREAILWLYQRDLFKALPMHLALAVGAAALEDNIPGTGRVFLRWHTTRLASPDPSLNAMIEESVQQEIEEASNQG